MITTVACCAIMTIRAVARGVKATADHLDDYKKKERELAGIKAEALEEMKRQRDTLRFICEEEYGRWDQTAEDGFDMIMSHACEEVYDAEGVAGGLDQILQLFGKSVRFKTMDEYLAQTDATLTLEF